MRNIVTPIDLDQDTGQGLSCDRVFDRTRVPAGHARLFYELYHFVSGRTFIPGDEDVARDRDVFFQQMCRYVLECRDDLDTVTEKVLGSFSRAAFRGELHRTDFGWHQGHGNIN